MVIELVHIGFDNFLVMNRVVAIASLNSEPIKRTMQEAKTKGLLIDMTHGRRTKAVIFTDDEHVVLSALAPETISSRLQTGRGESYLVRGGSVLKPEQSDERGEP